MVVEEKRRRCNCGGFCWNYALEAIIKMLLL
jgi:hypothetical protein